MHKQSGASWVELVVAVVIIGGLIVVVFWGAINWSVAPLWFDQLTIPKLGLALTLLAIISLLASSAPDKLFLLGVDVVQVGVAVIVGVAATYMYFQLVEVRNGLFSVLTFLIAAITGWVIWDLISEYVGIAIVYLWYVLTAAVFMALIFKVGIYLLSITY